MCATTTLTCKNSSTRCGIIRLRPLPPPPLPCASYSCNLHTYSTDNHSSPHSSLIVFYFVLPPALPSASYSCNLHIYSTDNHSSPHSSLIVFYFVLPPPSLLRHTPVISISTQLTIIPLRIVFYSSFTLFSRFFKIAFPLFISEANNNIFPSAIPLFFFHLPPKASLSPYCPSPFAFHFMDSPRLIYIYAYKSKANLQTLP